MRASFWKGRQFASLTGMQTDAVRWSTEVAWLRHSRALEGAKPLRVFEAIERDALMALLPRAFEFTSWSIGAVGVDAHLKVAKALFGAVAVDRVAPACPHRRRDRADLRRCRGGGHPYAPPVGTLYRLFPLPAGADRLPHAHPDLVSAHRRTGRPGL